MNDTKAKAKNGMGIGTIFDCLRAVLRVLRASA